MVEEFLKKEQELHLEKKLELTTKRESLNSKIKENVRFIEVLSDNNDSYFTEFTPRDLAFRNNDKIEELKNELNSLREELDSLEQEISYEEDKLEELAKVMGDMKEKRKNNNIEKNNEGDIITSLERILTYLPSDPMRARVELQSIINSKKSNKC